jgi:uncharacterized protein (DUF2267 family)
MGVFVVPLGMEREMQIWEEKAQENVRDQINVSRLVIAVLSRGHKYESIETIKAELSPEIMSICPKDCSNRT